MTSIDDLEPGDTIMRLNQPWQIEQVSETVTLSGGIPNKTIEETRQRVAEEIASDRAEVHPKCDRCETPQEPQDGPDPDRCYNCWFHQASLMDRLRAESDRIGPYSQIASEALRAEDPKAYLLAEIGDPVRSFHDRNDMQYFLSGVISTPELLDAMVKCEECGNGEQFQIVPETGEVKCHCGQQMASPDQ